MDAASPSAKPDALQDPAPKPFGLALIGRGLFIFLLGSPTAACGKVDNWISVLSSIKLPTALKTFLAVTVCRWRWLLYKIPVKTL